MKLSIVSLSALGLALNVAGQVSVIQGVVTSIEGKITTLDSAVKAYTSGSDISAIQSGSDGLISATNAGVTTVKGSAPLSQSDALGLIQPVQTLISDITTAINDLIAKKAPLQAACQGSNVLTDLNNQKAAAGALANAITAKVPTALQSTAAQLSAGVTNAIQKGIDAFQGSTCTSTSTGPSSTSSGSSGSSTAPSSSSPAGSSAPATSTPAGSSKPGSSSTAKVSPPASSSGAAPGGSSSAPGAPSASATPPPTFTGAATINGPNAAVGAVAAIAAVLAL